MKENEIKGEGLKNWEKGIITRFTSSLTPSKKKKKGEKIALLTCYNDCTDQISVYITMNITGAFKISGIKECESVLFIDKYLSSEEVRELVKNDRCPAIKDKLEVRYAFNLAKINDLKMMKEDLSHIFPNKIIRDIQLEYQNIIKAETKEEVIKPIVNVLKKYGEKLISSLIREQNGLVPAKEYEEFLQGKIKNIEEIRISY